MYIVYVFLWSFQWNYVQSLSVKRKGEVDLAIDHHKSDSRLHSDCIIFEMLYEMLGSIITVWLHVKTCERTLLFSWGPQSHHDWREKYKVFCMFKHCVTYIYIIITLFASTTKTKIINNKPKKRHFSFSVNLPTLTLKEKCYTTVVLHDCSVTAL